MTLPVPPPKVIPVTRQNPQVLRSFGRLTLWLLAALVMVAVVFGMFTFLLRVGLLGLGLRFLLVAAWLMAIVFDLGIRYVQHTYGLGSYRSAVTWLLASLGSPGVSQLKLWDTNLAPTSLEEPNLIKTVGGPGVVTLMSGLAALVEGLDGKVRVLEKGAHTLGRLERVKEVIKLDTVSGQIDSKTVTTRDGIPIDVTGIRFRYRQLQPEDGLEQAVKLHVYNLPQDAKGETDWARAVSGAVGGVIGRVVSENYVDYLTAPGFRGVGPQRFGQPAVAPRQLIQQSFARQGAKALQEIGAELLWYDIGHFVAPRDVLLQRADTWQKSWEGNLEILQAQSAEERSQYWAAENEGRLEAQTDLLIKIVKGLDEISAQSAQPAMTANTNLFITGMTQLLTNLDKAAGAE